MHDQLRVALCGLWVTGSLKDPAGASRQLLKLTRTSWALAYEAVTAAFVDAADAVGWQIRALLTALCVLCSSSPPLLQASASTAWALSSKAAAQASAY